MNIFDSQTEIKGLIHMKINQTLHCAKGEPAVSLSTCLDDIFMLDFHLLPGPLVTTVGNTNKKHISSVIKSKRVKSCPSKQELYVLILFE